nr:hypothetical protein [Tanacetum cinerariifolium]
FLCIHDDVDDLIKSALDSKLLLINSINSQRLDKKEQKVKIIEEQPAERRDQSDEVTESNAKNLLPIPSECEVTSEDKKEFYDDDFEDIEYVEASLPDPEIVSIEEENRVEEENLFSITRLILDIESLKDNPTPVCVFNSSTSIPILEESDNSLSLPEFETFYYHTEETRSDNTTTHANYSLPEYDSFRFEIEPDQEELFSVVMIDIPDNSSNDPLRRKEVGLFLSDDSIPPGIENVAGDPEGDIRFLEELLINDSILSHESSDSNFEDNPSISRPPPEPPDDNFDLEPEVISAVMEDIDEPDEHFNPGGEIFVSTNNEDVDYFPFMFVIRIFLPYLILPEISPLFLSAESEDTIFDPGISD